MYHVKAVPFALARPIPLSLSRSVILSERKLHSAQFEGKRGNAKFQRNNRIIFESGCFQMDSITFG